MAHHCPSASKAPHPCLSLSRCRPPPHGGTDLGYVSINFQQICKLSAFCTVSVSRLFPFCTERRERNWNRVRFPVIPRQARNLVCHTPMARRDAEQGSRTGATGVSPASFWPEVSPGREPTRKVHGRASRLKRVCAVPRVPCVLLIDPAHRDCARTRRRCVLHRKASRSRRLRAT